ncbi:MAG: HNH endonuclease [Chloroflexota bacterium]
MARQIKVWVQAGEALRFPEVCVHCGQPAEEWLPLHHRRGHRTRTISAPLCAECHRELQRLSADEERWRQMGWLFGGLTLLVVWLVLAFLSPGWLSLVWRLLLSLSLAATAGAVVFFYFRRASAQHARPEKKAILNAARLRDFSWRTTTLEFDDDSFAERFAALNEVRVVEEL